MIDRFTDYSNQVMQLILSFAKLLDFSYSSVLSWIYFMVRERASEIVRNDLVQV